MTTGPEASYSDDLYRFEWPDDQASIVMERFAEERGSIHAEVTCSTARPPNPGLLQRSKLNLLADRSITSMAKKLESRQADVDWDGMLTAACFLAIERYRQGEPLVDLVTLSHQTDFQPLRFVVPPFWEVNPSVVFADGDSGKSSFALALAVSVASGTPIVGDDVLLQGKVLFLDWETDEGTHAERLRALCAANSVELEPGAIEYRREYASLKESAPALRRLVAEHGFKAMIIDSLGAARGDEPENAGSTIALFGAIRQLGIPALLIDHVSHETARRNGFDAPEVPFGSRYTRNLSRLMWGMVAAKPSDESSVTYQRFKMRKGNNVGRMQERVLRMTYETDENERPTGIRFDPWELRRVPDFRATLGAWERMKDLMLKERRPVTIDEFVEVLGIKKATVQRALERNTEEVLNQGERGKAGAYVLRAREYAEEQEEEVSW